MLKSKHKLLDGGKLGWRILWSILLILFAVFCLYPFLVVLGTSFTPQEIIDSNGYSIIPKQFTWEGYKVVFMFPSEVVNAYGVSIFVTVVGTFLNMLFISMAAYPLSKSTYRYRGIVSFLIFFTMIFGGGIVPYYVLVTQYLNMRDTLWVLIIPVMCQPYHIFLLRIFYQDVPNEICESAKIDGAGEFTCFLRVATPLILPGLATVSLFVMLSYWNDVFTPKMFIEERNLRPLQLMLDQYQEYVKYISGEYGAVSGSGAQMPTDAALFAMCVITAGPMLFAFMFFQKYFVSGLTMGAVKG